MVDDQRFKVPERTTGPRCGQLVEGPSGVAYPCTLSQGHSTEEPHFAIEVGRSVMRWNEWLRRTSEPESEAVVTIDESGTSPEDVAVLVDRINELAQERSQLVQGIWDALMILTEGSIDTITVDGKLVDQTASTFIASHGLDGYIEKLADESRSLLDELGEALRNSDDPWPPK